MKTSNNCLGYLQSVVVALKQECCEPILLRNYDDFPKSIGNDLDVYIQPSKLDIARSIILHFAEKHGAIITHIHARSYFIALWLDFSDMHQPVHIDLYHGAASWHGLDYLKTNDLSLNSAPHPNFSQADIPLPWHEALISSMTSVLWGGFFKERYTHKIKNLLSDSNQRRSFEHHMCETFGTHGEMFAKAIIYGDPASHVTFCIKSRLCRNLFMWSIRSNPCRAFAKWINFWVIEAWCYIYRRPGLIIEYDSEAVSPQDKEEILKSLGPYFGASSETTGLSSVLTVQKSRFAARGRNYLLMVHSDKFAINGKKLMIPDYAKPTQILLEHAFKALKNRAMSYYSTW